MNFLALVPLRVWGGLALAVALVAGYWRLTAYYDTRGFKRAKAEDAAAMAAQQASIRDLMRAAELKYTVQQGVRDRFITQTITEVRHATENLAACPVGAPAVRLLNGAAICASGDPPAACGADLPLPGASSAR